MYFRLYLLPPATYERVRIMSQNSVYRADNRRLYDRSIAAQLTSSALATTAFVVASFAAFAAWNALQPATEIAIVAAFAVGLSVAVAVPLIASRCVEAAVARIDRVQRGPREHDEPSAPSVSTRPSRR